MKKPKHPLITPPDGAFDLHFLSATTNRWRKIPTTSGTLVAYPADHPDRIALAWVGKIENEGTFAWVATCSCKTHGECPASRALDKACDLWDGASLIRLPPYERKSK